MSQAADDAAMEFFQQDWMTYRKIVDSDYLFHREAYGRLHQLLQEEAAPGFHFLDIACGDASATMVALGGTRIGKYHGIDLSEPALRLARAQLAALACPIVLEQRDFFDALTEQPETADVVWIGLSLHHFQNPEKLRLMRAIRRSLGAGGILAIYENAGPDGDTREAWMERWDAQRPDMDCLHRGRMGNGDPSRPLVRLPRNGQRLARAGSRGRVRDGSRSLPDADRALPPLRLLRPAPLKAKKGHLEGGPSIVGTADNTRRPEISRS